MCLDQYVGKDRRGRAVWEREGCDKRKVTAGGGKNRETVTRIKCKSATPTAWRNHVDVDVDDEWDSPEKPMRQAKVNCRV